jgi:hypothetical protein
MPPEYGKERRKGEGVPEDIAENVFVSQNPSYSQPWNDGTLE